MFPQLSAVRVLAKFSLVPCHVHVRKAVRYTNSLDCLNFGRKREEDEDEDARGKQRVHTLMCDASVTLTDLILGCHLKVHESVGNWQ